MDKFLGIELDGYGFTIDSYWAYISLSWEILATSALVIVALKLWRKSQNKF